MKIHMEEIRPGVTVIAVDGDVDMSTSPDLRTVLVPAFQKGISHVVVDLSGVSYIDSSGIATLVEGLQLSRKSGTRFALARVSAAVGAVFELAYLKDVFEMVDGVEQLFP